MAARTGWTGAWKLGRGVRRFGAVAALLAAAGCAEDHAATRASAARTGGASSAQEGVQGAPCQDGEVRACHVTLGEHDGVSSCFVGVTTCEGGALGPCVEGSLAEAEGGMVARGASTSDSCANNPCDPYCHQVKDEPQGGLAAVAAAGGTWVGGSLAGVPGGFQNKGLKDAKHPPEFEPCESASDCQFDNHCVAGACVAWAPGEHDVKCAAADLTVGVACADGVPVCNRGSVEAPAGVELVVMNGNSEKLQDDLGTCGASAGTGTGSCATDAPIAPGACVTVKGCPLDGVRTIRVNPPTAKAPVAECQCGNDWSVYSAGNACVTYGAPVPEATFVETYAPSCPAGTRVQWGFLAYEADVPSDASGSARIAIDARAKVSAAVSAAPARLARVPATHPASCSLGGPAPCPVDLFAELGSAAAAHAEQMVVTFKLTPTPSGAKAPVVKSWQITYSCPPSE
jgi:hypothetical protein